MGVGPGGEQGKSWGGFRLHSWRPRDHYHARKLGKLWGGVGEGKTKMYCVLLLLLRAVVQKGGNGTFSSLPRLLLLAFFAFCGEKKERKKKITLSHRVS